MKKFIFLILVIFTSISMLQAEEVKKEKSAAEYVADLSTNNEEAVIITAIEYVSKEKEKSAIQNLINLLSDKRESVRAEAASALGYIGEESAVESLNNTLLNDESAIVRYAAVLASVRIGSKKSIDALKKASESESDPFIKDILTKMEEKAKGK